MSATEPATEPDTADAARAAPAATAAGRGVLWISAAKILFVLFGFAVQFGLPRALSGPTEFGLLSAAIAFTVILTNAMTASMVQTTSKLVAERGAIGRPLAVRHAALALVLATGVLGAAGLVGSYVLASRAIVPLVRLASVVVLAYAIYATAIGALNGARAFERQARLDATFSTVRTVGLLGGGLALGLATSAMAGFAAAAVTMAAIGTVVARLHASPAGDVPSPGEHLRVLLPIALYQLALNGLLQLDLEVLVTGVTLEAAARGLDEAAAAEAGAEAAGLYRVAQTLAFVPYQLMTSVTLVLFPVVAHASSQRDEHQVREAVRAALRFSLLFVVGLLAPLAGAGRAAVRLAFPSAYEGAEAVIPLLAVAQVAFGMGVIQATVLVGRGRLWRAVAMVGAGLGASLGGALIGWWIAPGSLAFWTAGATAAGSLLFALLTGASVHFDLDSSVTPVSAARALVAGACAVGVGHALPVEGRVAGLGVLVLAGVVYVVVLALLRELGPADVALVRRIAGRGR